MLRARHSNLVATWANKHRTRHNDFAHMLGSAVRHGLSCAKSDPSEPRTKCVALGADSGLAALALGSSIADLQVGASNVVT
ncbi:hypothetical protein MES5069_390052 [Mesorhizobium escarrei]|uniref:Uncharacterized protein n=1 Tax=Mesorhizobium escarrei TaxID=666018 RepID=A0ABM9E474_9HYPH|nr:hypothetical protein MES5069_390052 [Mesorhizobium escarrei]